MKLKAVLLLSLIFINAHSIAADKFGIVIHGGAGTIKKENLTNEKLEAINAVLTKATEAGYSALENGESSLDAIAIAINILEDSPIFNAGLGAVYTYDGLHALDASIMDGATRNAGAIAGVAHIKNPINLARTVMDKSVHVMLSGAGAEEFAIQQGFDLVPADYFDTPHRYEAWKKARQRLADAKTLEQQASVYLQDDFRYGTVGAVALDKNGNLAAGTSTGGMTAKRFDRIGDSPVIGAGTWADNNSCAVSATGHGEYFIRNHVAADICARVKYQNKSVETAAEEIIQDVLKPIGGTGGVIVIDAQGNFTMEFNTPGMYRAVKTTDKNLEVGIFAKN